MAVSPSDVPIAEEPEGEDYSHVASGERKRRRYVDSDNADANYNPQPSLRD